MDGKCRYCGASQKTFDRGEGLETHAYAFIHTDDIKARIAELFGGDMQFDVIIGNPPYQLDDGGYGTSAAPIYQLFVEQALDLDPRYLSMVIPSRWFAGGKGLDEFREAMLTDKRMRSIVDYPKLYEAFPGVKIQGRHLATSSGIATTTGRATSRRSGTASRSGQPSRATSTSYDIFVRRNEAVPILREGRARKDEPTLDRRVSSRQAVRPPRRTSTASRRTRASDDPSRSTSTRTVAAWIDRERRSPTNAD